MPSLTSRDNDLPDGQGENFAATLSVNQNLARAMCYPPFGHKKKPRQMAGQRCVPITGSLVQKATGTGGVLKFKEF